MAEGGRRLHYVLGLLILLLLQSQVNQAIVATYCSSLNTANGPPANHSMYMSEGSCRDTCSGYSYGVTQGWNCWCSNFTPGSTTSLYDCNTECPGYSEYCGSTQDDLFNYLYLGVKPDGIVGGGGSGGGGGGGDSVSTSATTVTKTSSIEPITRTVPETVYETKKTTIRGSAMTTTLVKTNTITGFTTSSTTSHETPTTLTDVVTINGVTTTQRVTSYAPAPPPSSGSSPVITETHSGLSGGAVAGIAIGVVAAVAILGLLVYFCCFRRKTNGRRNIDEQGLGRNTSVLSKAGLLRHGSTHDQEATATSSSNPTSAVKTRPPRLMTDIPNVSSGVPSSAATGGTTTSRRDSRPIFVDQRLNPNALTAHPNPSQTSLSTLHDDKDYSRPLEVRNPDPPPRLL